VESLISKGANVLIILAMDADAILPAVKKAGDEGIPVIAYDRDIESPSALYLTFDNVGVGRMMAKAILEAKPAGNYAFITGDKGDPNANFLFSGITAVLKPAMTAGKIKNVGETYTDGWKPDNAQKNMEQILPKTNDKVDAVVAENDGMAGGVVAALSAQVSRARCLSRVRMAITRRSTASRSAPRRSRSGRTAAISASSPANPPSRSPRART
jgi:D-xylose transport system substrate-binding protein